jgi:hypothetical protein
MNATNAAVLREGASPQNLRGWINAFLWVAGLYGSEDGAGDKA